MQRRPCLPTIILLILFSNTVQAQDTLPGFSARLIKNKAVIGWKNTYGARITHINIQRSSDSLRNFTSIGSVLEPNNPENGYVDSKMPDPQSYYRIFLSFAGGSYLYTKSKKPYTDTTSARDLTIKEDGPKSPPAPKAFIPSRHVYVAGKENNVTISLPLAEERRYSIRFFDDHQKPLFSLDKITEPLLIMEKVNFIRSGWYYFELTEDGNLLEKSKFYIPKEGKYGTPPGGDYNKRFR